MGMGTAFQLPTPFIMVTWKNYCWMRSMNLDEAAPTVLTVTAHLAPRHHKTPTERKQTPTALERKTALSEKDYIERREVESILKKSSDWIWDWSSRPENIPHKEFLFKHPKRTATLSMRNTNVMKKGGVFSADCLKVFLPSLLLSHLLATGLRIYIGRRLTTSTVTF